MSVFAQPPVRGYSAGPSVLSTRAEPGTQRSPQEESRPSGLRAAYSHSASVILVLDHQLASGRLVGGGASRYLGLGKVVKKL
jgi:hypothetical protein